MLKKNVILLVMLVYLGVSTGFTVNIHYCFGQLSSVSFSSTTECSCGSSLKYHCCKTDSLKIGLKDKYQLRHAVLLQEAVSLQPVQQYVQFSPRTLTLPLLLPLYGARPPDLPAAPIYLLNNTFRI